MIGIFKNNDISESILCCKLLTFGTCIKYNVSYLTDAGNPVFLDKCNMFNILLAPGGEKASENVVVCELLFDNEVDLRKAYNILIQEGQNYSIGSYPWAPVGALVTDKYGVTWWLRT